ncbi:hypothetical protein ACFWJV_02990 [Streptomyces rochei]|uniref:hypothetical protein n=1 Tax=Streptomyces TaxID=1883 RepID=UPI000F7A547C|nr:MULTISPECIES: hypothetical protein [Streptomyces]RSS92701.1 hypothetical protein EF919_17820 [Streptomyces sp. WAC02707]WMI59374.1 hypothetical protein RBH85_23305 [Streptomyces rochei]
MPGGAGTPGPAAGGVRIAPVVLKVLITVVVSTVAYVITNLFDQTGDDLWKIAVSVVIGGSALIVQYMVDFEQRLGAVESGHRERSRELEGHFNHLSDAAGLLGELDQAGMSTSDARRLIKSLNRVGAQGPEIVKAFARSEVENLASVVTDLTGMTAHWPRDNNEWLIRLTECARRTIDATSSSVDQPFWSTDSAGPYLDAQAEAMRVRGVTIRRLFMIREDERSNPEFMERFQQLCQDQRDAGISVRVRVLSPAQQLDRPLPRPVVARDVVIFDSELYLEFDPDRQEGNVQTRLDAEGRRVDGQVRTFNALWATATEEVPSPAVSG